MQNNMHDLRPGTRISYQFEIEPHNKLKWFDGTIVRKIQQKKRKTEKQDERTFKVCFDDDEVSEKRFDDDQFNIQWKIIEQSTTPNTPIDQPIIQYHATTDAASTMSQQLLDSHNKSLASYQDKNKTKIIRELINDFYFFDLTDFSFCLSVCVLTEFGMGFAFAFAFSFCSSVCVLTVFGLGFAFAFAFSFCFSICVSTGFVASGFFFCGDLLLANIFEIIVPLNISTPSFIETLYNLTIICFNILAYDFGV
jgi:hypothetical protein